MADEARPGATVAGFEEVEADTKDVIVSPLESPLSTTQSHIGSIQGHGSSGKSTGNSVTDDALEDHSAVSAAGQTRQSIGSRDNNGRSDSFASGGAASNFSAEEPGGSGFPTEADDVEAGDGSLAAGPQIVGSRVMKEEEELAGIARDRRGERIRLSKGLRAGNTQVWQLTFLLLLCELIFCASQQPILCVLFKYI